MYPPWETLSEPAPPGKEWCCCLLWQHRDGVLWKNPGQLLVHDWAPLFWREASCQMFPDSLLRYCCLTGLFLDQVGFSTGYLKNICLMLEDKSPTRQKNPLAPGFFGEWGRMGWGRLGLQVKQKRGSGLLRLWSRVEDSFGWLYQLLSCVTLYWLSGVPKANCPLSGVNHSW